MYIIRRSIRPQEEIFESDNVLLFSGGGIGDAVMDASAWATLIDFYSGQGKNIYIICPKENLNLLKRIPDTGKARFIEAVPDKDITRESVADLFDKIGNMTFDTIAARVHGSVWNYLEANALTAKRKYVVIEQEMLRGLRAAVMKLLPARFTTVITETPEMNERDAVEQLLRQMGIKDYKMRILPIPKQCEFNYPQREYITVAVDSRNPKRRWTSDKFIKLIRQLLNDYEYDIYITGSYLGPEDIKLYNSAFMDNDRVVNLVGKQSFEEWIELLRGARFHIGIDSGSIHIAASVDTWAFCLAGVWQGYRFFPYDMEDSPYIKKPICVYRSDVDVRGLKCHNCAGRRTFGAGNKVCRSQCRNGEPCQCLTAITVEDVLLAIKEARQDGMIS